MKSYNSNLLLAVLLSSTMAMIQSSNAATTFVWNVPSPGANNWNINANWSPNTGNPGVGDTALFGATGFSSDPNTINNVVSVNTTIAALSFTNNATGTWHVTQIPSGVTLTVSGATTVSAGGSVNGLVTSAAM